MSEIRYFLDYVKSNETLIEAKKELSEKQFESFKRRMIELAILLAMGCIALEDLSKDLKKEKV